MPLVAVQPLYAHPFAAAKSISTMAYLYERRICVNMVAGGFRNDLVALDDDTPHDERYDRVVEYVLLMKELLGGMGPVTFQGEYYRVKNLKLTPPVPDELRPDFFVSGSSRAGLGAARTVGATAVKYPGPSGQEHGVVDEPIRCGVRVGIIARECTEDAWAVAHSRFPLDRKGQIAHSMAMTVSDSKWHGQLSAMGRRSSRPHRSPMRLSHEREGAILLRRQASLEGPHRIAWALRACATSIDPRGRSCVTSGSAPGRSST